MKIGPALGLLEHPLDLCEQERNDEGADKSGEEVADIADCLGNGLVRDIQEHESRGDAQDARPQVLVLGRESNEQ